MFRCAEPRRTPDPQDGKTILQAASLFNQLLQHFPRNEFGALVKKHNAGRAAIAIPAGDRFDIGDIVFARGIDAEPVAKSAAQPDAEAQAASRFDPLAFSGGRIVPTLVATVSRKPGSKLRLFCVIHSPIEGAEGAGSAATSSGALAAPVTIRLDIYRDSKIVASDSAPLAAQPGEHSLPYLAAIPADAFPPGQYEVVISASRGTARASTREMFEVVE